MFYKIVLEDGHLSLKSLIESVLLAIPSCGRVLDFLKSVQNAVWSERIGTQGRPSKYGFDLDFVNYREALYHLVKEILAVN